MTAEQLTLDCDPTWRDHPDDLDRLCDLGAELLHADVDYRDRDLLGQRASAHRIVTATTVPTGSYL